MGYDVSAGGVFKLFMRQYANYLPPSPKANQNLNNKIDGKTAGVKLKDKLWIFLKTQTK